MADETDKPKRPRRRRKPKGEAEADTASTSAAGEVEPTPADVEAADEAADVVLEAADEVDADSEPEAKPEKPKRAPRRRRAAKPKAEEPEAAKREEPDEEPEAAEEPETAEEPEKPERPAPARRRAPRDPSLPPPVVRAQAKYVRTSARKARLVCDHIRGKSVDEARAILAHTPRVVARDWTKLLESAIANAENNHELVGEDLYLKVVQADEGPTLKRYRPRAMGRATRIRKRTSHLTILLEPKE